MHTSLTPLDNLSSEAHKTSASHKYGHFIRIGLSRLQKSVNVYTEDPTRNDSF